MAPASPINGEGDRPLFWIRDSRVTPRGSRPWVKCEVDQVRKCVEDGHVVGSDDEAIQYEHGSHTCMCFFLSSLTTLSLSLALCQTSKRLFCLACKAIVFACHMGWAHGHYSAVMIATNWCIIITQYGLSSLHLHFVIIDRPLPTCPNSLRLNSISCSTTCS